MLFYRHKYLSLSEASIFYIRICSLIILSSIQMACMLSILTAFFQKSWGKNNCILPLWLTLQLWPALKVKQ